jgi:hypothetical protein
VPLPHDFGLLHNELVNRLREALLYPALLAREAYPLVINSVNEARFLAIVTFRYGELHARSAIFVRH